MSKMKYSGVKWIGNIPNNWIIKKIKYLKKDELNSFVDGNWIDSQYISEKGIRYYTTGNIGDGIFKEQGFGYITEETFKLLKCKYAYAGDLVFSRLNSPYGRSCILPNDNPKCVLAVDNVVLRTSQEKRYICYVTQTNGYHKSAEDYSNGSTMQRLSRINLGNIFIPLPPLKEQKLISKFLDKKVNELDQVLNDLNSQIEILYNYKSTVIFEKVTKGLNKKTEYKKTGIKWIDMIPVNWSIKRFKYLLKEIKVGPFGSALSGDDLKIHGNYWVYNQRTVLDNNFSTNDTFIDKEKFNELKSFQVKKGDLLLTTRGTIGKLAIVPENYKKGVLHPCLIRFVVDEKLMNPKLLQLVFNNTPMIQEQLNYKSNSTTIDVIYSYNLKDIYIPIMPIDEQKEIVDYLEKKCEQIDKIIEDKQKQIQNIEEYKKSVIYEYVTGKKIVEGAEELYG